MNQMTRIGEALVDEVRTRPTTAEFLHMNECGAFDDLKVELADGDDVTVDTVRFGDPLTVPGTAAAITLA